jgi:hypothetical protein
MGCECRIQDLLGFDPLFIDLRMSLVDHRTSGGDDSCHCRRNRCLLRRSGSCFRASSASSAGGCCLRFTTAHHRRRWQHFGYRVDFLHGAIKLIVACFQSWPTGQSPKEAAHQDGRPSELLERRRGWNETGSERLPSLQCAAKLFHKFSQRYAPTKIYNLNAPDAPRASGVFVFSSGACACFDQLQGVDRSTSPRDLLSVCLSVCL